MTRVQRNQVRQALRETARSIRELKAVRDESGQPNWGPRCVGELDKLRERATILAALVARRRQQLFERRPAIVRAYLRWRGRAPNPHITRFPFQLTERAAVRTREQWEALLDYEEMLLDGILRHARVA